MAGHCGRCSAVLGPLARFCASCGAPTSRGRTERRTRSLHENLGLVRAGAALAIGFVGALLSGVLGADAQHLQAQAEAATLVVCLAVLGGQDRMDAFSSVGAPRAYALAALVVACGLGVSLGYVRLLALIAGEGQGREADAEGLAARLVWWALAPGVLEELLCRGVLFTATERLVSGRPAIVASAVVFAFLHGLNGLWLLELPHRFVLGLLLGWLRLYAGSLWPCVAAHVLHNSIVVTLLV